MSRLYRFVVFIALTVMSLPLFAAQLTLVEQTTVHTEAAGGIVAVALPGGFPQNLVAPDDYSTGMLHHRVTVNNLPAGANDTQYRICFVQGAANRACSNGIQFNAVGAFDVNQTVATLVTTGVVDWTMPLTGLEIAATDTEGVAVDATETTWIGAPDFTLYYPLDVTYEAVVVSNGDVFAGFPSDNRVANPEFSPPAGTYELVANVSITSETANAMIYYTTDGSEPTEASTLFDGTAIEVTADSLLRARAFEGALEPSGVVDAGYTIVAQLTEGLRGRYYNSDDFSNFIVSRTDPQIDFQFAGGSEPAPGVDGGFFSAIWTGQVTPLYSEVYTFSTINDDGTRLWVNNVLVIDDWNYHGPERREGTVSLQAGESYSVWMEYFNGGGDGQAVLQWASVTQPEEVIPNSALIPTSPANQQPQISIFGEEEAPQIFELSVDEAVFVEIRRRANIDEAVTVNLTYGGDAENGVDYQQLPATVDFAAGEIVTYLEIFPIDDETVEEEETLTITVAEGNYSVSEPATVTATILDNDVEITTISGSVIYTGTESGQLVVSAFRDEDQPHQAVIEELLNPGPFELVVEGGSYTVVAFVDSNDNDRVDPDEIWGQYQDENFALLKVDVPPSAENIVINLDVAPGIPPGDDGDGGCCATHRPSKSAPLLWVLIIGIVGRRIRRKRK